MDADAYPDSSFPVSLFRVDDNHEVAMRYMLRSAEKLAFNPLHRLELRNALRRALASGKSPTMSAGWLFAKLSKI
jgi:hypothetical protein